MIPADVIAEIEKQLAWRGSSGNSIMGHIVIERKPAQILIDYIRCLQDQIKHAARS